MLLSLHSQSYVFDPRPHSPLLVSVKRYWVPRLESKDPGALTLVLMHGVSFHNEQWEPLLEDLYRIMATTDLEVPIRDVWAIEAPTHGESAVLNDAVLHPQAAQSFSSYREYKNAVHLVLSGQGKGIDVDFKTRDLIGVGHSMGCVPLLMSRTLKPTIPWKGAILVEPVIMHPVYDLQLEYSYAARARRRHDVWRSREEARKAFREKALRTWDPRVIDVYVRYGLRDLPTAHYPDKTGVTLKCRTALEIAAYCEPEDRLAAPRQLSSFCANIPTHAIFGSIEDAVPVRNRDFIINEVADRKFRTVKIVEGAGHLCVQENPEGVAEHVYSALAWHSMMAFSSLPETRSKL
ncbi:alpha/beta-hydrolase [Artomyces pyxidatus]|uniref:Alpha/beta-hydrolase n=1 Tax=Artomyces pyxidatus TaxID=48021 RepID=A0ACB8SX22_9AGAM|nr:alpha/beta-hydrolase [Artomyces pyxidatus]